MSSWGDLSQGQRGYYIAFHLGGDNGHPDMPNNNTHIGYGLCTPSDGEINSVSDTGYELVRTINYRLTETQKNAVRDWVFYHGTNQQIGRLIQPNEDPFEDNEENNEENINNDINNIINNIIDENINIYINDDEILRQNIV